ncbi:hypothetical protein C8Q76DRAFT_616320 [Earliella scabrosa]|nr:hypothetical protein C8Q76DRAFT_616320 [Earliella scabrosa]
MELSALLCFDYVLTLGPEIRFIWPRGLCASSVLFYAGRYPPLLTAFILCFAENWTRHSLQVLFATLRVYAISDGSWASFAAVLILSMVNPAIMTVRSNVHLLLF